MDPQEIAIQPPEAPRRRLTTKDMEALLKYSLQFPTIPGLLSSEEEDAAQQELATQLYEQMMAQHQRHMQGLLGGDPRAQA